MDRFSDRLGLTSPPPFIVGSINSAIQIAIWNTLIRTVRSDRWRVAAELLAIEVFNEPADRMLTYDVNSYDLWVKTKVLTIKPWYTAYNVLQFASDRFEETTVLATAAWQFRKLANELMARAGGGYRFADDQLLPITNEEEMAAVARAAAGRSPWSLHLQAAGAALRQTPEPDYRNSVKEAISAVESIVRIVAGGGGLKAALLKVESAGHLHLAMREGFLKLYGYTSDEGGIRHALLEPNEKVGLDEAKFMLVACSAFVNFLQAKVR